jgi:hypothetical protein
MTAIEFLRKNTKKLSMLADIGDNIFRNADFYKCHDWRNHVDEEIKYIWRELSHESRLCVMLMANNIAEREEWD